MKDYNKGNKIQIDTMHAEATTTVHKYETVVYDNPKEGPTLSKSHLEESFHGDIEALGIAETMQVNHADKTSDLMGIERMTGKIGQRKGSFLFQVTARIEGKNIKSGWIVIPGSGTGQLTGLRGDGGFEAKLGTSGKVYLDYWFE